DIHAELDAFVADEDGRPGNQLPDFVLALAAEGTAQRIFRVAAAGLRHRYSITRSGGTHPTDGPGLPRPPGRRDRKAQPGARRRLATAKGGKAKYRSARRTNNRLKPPLPAAMPAPALASIPRQGKSGDQDVPSDFWMPACAGMTQRSIAGVSPAYA